MKDRWLPVGVLAGVLFLVNVIVRLVIRLGFNGDTAAEDRATLVMFTVIGLISAGVVFVWGRRRPAARWTTDLGAALLAAMLLTVLVGPFISGGSPFSRGAGDFFTQIWIYALFTLGGAALGYLLLMALGWDYRSQSLKRFADAKLSRPRRVIRR